MGIIWGEFLKSAAPGELAGRSPALGRGRAGHFSLMKSNQKSRQKSFNPQAKLPARFFVGPLPAFVIIHFVILSNSEGIYIMAYKAC
jgi:hypothetical protein